jgi:predicted flap endonuclease-1-like 5' DNA nuclease
MAGTEVKTNLNKISRTQINKAKRAEREAKKSKQDAAKWSTKQRSKNPRGTARANARAENRRKINGVGSNRRDRSAKRSERVLTSAQAVLATLKSTLKTKFSGG